MDGVGDEKPVDSVHALDETEQAGECMLDELVVDEWRENRFIERSSDWISSAACW